MGTVRNIKRHINKRIIYIMNASGAKKSINKTQHLSEGHVFSYAETSNCLKAIPPC